MARGRGLDPSTRRQVRLLAERLADLPRCPSIERFEEEAARRRLFGIDRDPVLAAYARLLVAATHRNRRARADGGGLAGALLERLHLLHRLAPGVGTFAAEARRRDGPLPLVTVLVAGVAGGGPAAARAIASIRVMTGYPAYEVRTVEGADLGAAVGEAVEASRGRYVVFLRADASVRGAAWLYDLVETAETHPRIGAVGAAAAWDAGDEAYADVLFPGLTVPVSWLAGSCLLVRREAFREVGGLRTDLYGSDPWAEVHLGYALRARGWISVAPPAPIPVAFGTPADGASLGDALGAAPTPFRRRFGGRDELLDAARGPETVRGRWDAARGRWVGAAAVAAA